MTSATGFNLMIAHANDSRWAAGLQQRVASWPVHLHWPRTSDEVISLATTMEMHLAILDDDLPDAGGRGAVRRLRRLGLELPCLLVCKELEPRVLHDAISLDVFSVLEAESECDILTPTILRVANRVYNADWASPSGFN